MEKKRTTESVARQVGEHTQIMEPLLNAKEVKQILRCSLPLVYKMAERGQIPSIRIPCPTLGTRKKEMVRFKRDDVLEFIQAHYRR